MRCVSSCSWGLLSIQTGLVAGDIPDKLSLKSQEPKGQTVSLPFLLGSLRTGMCGLSMANQRLASTHVAIHPEAAKLRVSEDQDHLPGVGFNIY